MSYVSDEVTVRFTTTLRSVIHKAAVAACAVVLLQAGRGLDWDVQRLANELPRLLRLGLLAGDDDRWGVRADLFRKRSARFDSPVGQPPLR